MDIAIVSQHLNDFFGVDGLISALGSCEDLNFKLKVDGGVSGRVGKYVVKYIRNGPDSNTEDHIKVQHKVMLHLQSANLPFRCPAPVSW